MKKIKVCHMSSAHIGLDVRIFYKQCISLSKNYDVSLVICATDKEAHFAKENNINLIQLKQPSSRVNRMFIQSFKCFCSALKTNSKIYHFHDPELIPYGIILRLLGKRVIYDVHEDLPEDIMGKRWIPPYLKKFVRNIISLKEFFVSKIFFDIIAATPFILERFLKANNNAININNYPLFNEIPEKARDRFNFNKICYIGGINETRGLYELVQACSSLNYKVSLSIAGNFLDEKFKEKLKSHHYWGEVDFHGYINRNEVQKILANSSVGIVTLHPTNAYIESLPVKMFEYMAHGMPIIASNFPRWKKIIEDYECGLLVDPTSPDQISNAIKTLIDNPEVAKKMGLNGRNAVITNYNWRQEEDKLLSFYEK